MQKPAGCVQPEQEITLHTPFSARVDDREIRCLSAQRWPTPLGAEELLTGSSRPIHPAGQALLPAHSARDRGSQGYEED